MTNEARFVTDGFGNNRVAPRARIRWIVINSRQPTTLRYQIQQTQLILQDQLFNFGDATKEIDHNVFRINPLPNASYEKLDGTQ